MKKIHINNDDNYATPPEFYEELNKRFKFDFDPCPYNEKDVDIDGLNIEWGMSNFINPPYSQKLKEAFIKKGIEEMKKGKVCVFLILVSTSTKLFHDYIKPNATEIEFVRGRIKFGKVDNDGNFYYPVNSKGKVQSGTKDSMIVVFDGRKIKNMEIKFIESHSFLGEHMTMEVNGNQHRLEYDKNCSYEQYAVNLLKEIYDVDFKVKDVRFEWDGTL